MNYELLNYELLNYELLNYELQNHPPLKNDLHMSGTRPYLHAMQTNILNNNWWWLQRSLRAS